MQVTKQYRRQRIKMRLRKKIKGTEAVPRLSIFRSNRDIYAQIINDTDGKTLVAVSSRDKDFVKKGTKTRDIYAQIINDTDGKTLVAVSSRDKDFVKKGTKTENSKELGKALATKALETGITAVVFDRNGYLYHGRVKALAESAREGGLKF